MVNPYFVHNSLFLPFLTLRRRVRRQAVIRVSTTTLLAFTVLGAVSGSVMAQNGRRGTVPRRTAPNPEAVQADSLRRANARQAIQDKADSIRAVRSANRRPTVNWPDRYATRFSEKTSRSPFILRDPKAVGTDVRLDNQKNVSVYERVGSGAGGLGQGAQGVGTSPTSGTNPSTDPSDRLRPMPQAGSLPFRPGESIPFNDYNVVQNQRAERSLWREYSSQRDGQSATKGRGLFPKLELPSSVDRLFGGTSVDFKPNGFVMLDFGYLHQFIDNPQIPVQQRRQGNFLFNEQININFNGKIGERLGMLANFDTKASFNFENALKLNYKPEGLVPGLPKLPNAPNLSQGLGAPSVPDFTPKSENILQGLELGNISWPINSQLIPGVQNLFGVKTQLRFGRLNATIVGSQQRSKKQEITLRAGQVGRPFELRADQYDENRHFFLSQFFRDNYERGLKSLPMITTGVNITRVEVYVTNRTNTTESLRNIAGFSDLGENRRLNSPNNPNVQIIAG
ncbi:MAG: cell surface protein SprA, partial [Rudanella sp.]|nr:cell surface protein SprA [Rudanella sp.]